MHNSSLQPDKLICSLCLFCGFFLLSTIASADHPTLGLKQDEAGSITTVSAIPLPKGKRSIGFESQFISNHEISDSDLLHHAEHGDNVHSSKGINSISFSGAYGITDNLTFGYNLPYISRLDIRESAGAHHDEAEDEHSDDGGSEETEAGTIANLGDASGFGDLTIYGQYRFAGSESSRLHASALFGFKAPTGNTHINSNEGHRFETDHQPGSGSWDVLSGLALTQQWSGATLDSNILYAFTNTGSQNTNLGDVFNYNIALSIRLNNSGRNPSGGFHSHLTGNPRFWDLSLELNGEWRDQATIAGGLQHNTGGNIVFLAPSVRYGWGDDWSAYFSFGVPVIKNLNGVQSDPKYRLFAGVGFGVGGAKQSLNRAQARISQHKH